jgi:hypothetical protein
MKKENIDIYFHVGTGKTGSTFLQKKVFPKMKNIHYIPTNQYRNSKAILEQKKYSSYLISREFDRQLEEEIKWFSKDFPNSTPIIVFRKHSSYIASQFRRFVKNGWRKPFNDFFNFENTGHFKIEHLDYCKQINILNKYFEKEVIILNFDTLKNTPESFLNKLINGTSSSLDLDDVNIMPLHKSYSEKQLKLIYKLSRFLPLKKRAISNFKTLNFLYNILLFYPFRYSIFYLLNFIPQKLIDEIPLINNEELIKIDEYFKNDWKRVLELTT